MNRPHTPRKRFGQNFLHDPRVIENIVQAINPQGSDRLVEIGPGMGALTFELLKHLPSMEAVELDRDLIEYLGQHTPEGKQLTVHSGDVLAFNFDEFARKDTRALRLVGNLPYNISTPLIFHLLAAKSHVQDMHFMLQKEVVDRMAAGPGSKAYGRLSVMTQYHCHVYPLFDVPPGAFNPPPKVNSSIVRLVPREAPPCDVGNEQQFAHVVQSAFAMRRKTLRNCLKHLMNEDTIRSLGVDPTLRPELITLSEFGTLSKHLSSEGFKAER